MKKLLEWVLENSNGSWINLKSIKVWEKTKREPSSFSAIVCKLNVEAECERLSKHFRFIKPFWGLRWELHVPIISNSFVSCFLSPFVDILLWKKQKHQVSNSFYADEMMWIVEDRIKWNASGTKTFFFFSLSRRTEKDSTSGLLFLTSKMLSLV